MKLREIRHREEVEYPTLELTLVDPPDAEYPKESAQLVIRAEKIHSEPTEYEAGYIRHHGYSEVEEYSYFVKFKGHEHLGSGIPADLIVHLDEHEHEDLKSLIHAAREGLLNDRALETKMDTWVTRELNDRLDQSITPVKRYGRT